MILAYSSSERPHVTFEPAMCFLRKLWVSTASLLGEKAEAVADGRCSWTFAVSFKESFAL